MFLKTSSASCGLCACACRPLAIATLRRHTPTLPITRRVVCLNLKVKLPDRSARAVDKTALGIWVTNNGFAVLSNRIDKGEWCAKCRGPFCQQHALIDP